MEPRLIDNIKCNPNTHPDCEVYSMGIDRWTSLTELIINYAVQDGIVYLAAGAGMTAFDDYNWATFDTLYSLLSINFILFTVPAFILTINKYLHWFSGFCVKMIIKYVNNFAWIEYSLAVVFLLLDVFTE